MSAQYSRLWFIVFLGLILSVGMSISSYLNSSPSIAPVANNTIIDEAMWGVHFSRYDEQGRLHQVIKMQQWQRYQGEKVTHFFKPELNVHQLDGSVWNLSAKTGQAFQPNLGKPLDKVVLNHDVHVQRIGTTRDNWFELTTQSLTYFPKKSLAVTDQPLMIIGQGMQMQAVGLRASLENHTIEFLNKVTGHYALPSA